jgi:hypothetical protein
MRPIVHSANSGTMHAISQAMAPALIAAHSTRRPWKMRAALQIIPQAMNNSVLATPGGSGGEIRFSKLQTATENPPRRYAVPHQASARMRSCAQADRSSSPSSAVMQVATMNNVVMSSATGALLGDSMADDPSDWLLVRLLWDQPISLSQVNACGLCFQALWVVSLITWL